MNLLLLVVNVVDVFREVVDEIPICTPVVCTAIGLDLDELSPRCHAQSSGTTFTPKIVGDLDGVFDDEHVFYVVVVVCKVGLVLPPSWWSPRVLRRFIGVVFPPPWKLSEFFYVPAVC